MRKKIWLALSFIVILLISCLTYLHIHSKGEADIYFNGVKLKTHANIQNQLAYLPVKTLHDMDGYTVHFDEAKNTVFMEKGDMVIKVPLNKDYLYINTLKKKMNEPAIMDNGKVYVPLRFITELIGYDVDWNPTNKTIAITNNPYKYDVIVIGAEPEGISAAIAAARQGEKTLLIDKRDRVGGLFTIGMLNSIDMNMHEGKLITRGAFEEFYKKIGKRTAFDVKEAQKVFDEMIANEPNITLVLNADSYSPVVSNDTIQALDVQLGEEKVRYIGKQFIDSTTDADIAYQAGESFTFGQEDYRQTKETMAVTLVFELAGVDFDRVFDYLNYEDDDKGTGADKMQAWGYPEMYDYTSTQDDVSIRALNVALQKNGNVLVNGLWISNVDGTDSVQLKDAKEKAIQELKVNNGIIDYINEHLVGFEQATLVGYADELYVRETRHLEGQYRLTINDLLENRDFEDKIAFGNYPLDVQASATQKDFIGGNPQQYSVPFRSIVPKKINNLLVASRSASYDSLAHGSTRVVPIGMNLGQAAGITASYANEKNVDFITMANQKGFTHIQNIQRILNTNGAHLDDFPAYDIPIMEHWAYDGVKFFRTYGLVYGGYYNEYEMDKTVSKSYFYTIVTEASKRSEANKSFRYWFENEDSDEFLKVSELKDFVETNDISLSKKTKTAMNKLSHNDDVTKDLAIMVGYESLR